MPTLKATQHKPVSFDKFLLVLDIFLTIFVNLVFWPFHDATQWRAYLIVAILGSGSRDLILIRLSGGPTLDDQESTCRLKASASVLNNPL